MVARAGPVKSSCNAGEFSDDLKGRIDVKQYYSAALRMKNIEPVPQSGFRLMPGSAFIDTARSANVRHATLAVTPFLSYTLIFTPGFVDIYRNDRTKVASVAIAAITSALLPELEFYGEANTFGVFHEDLRTLRLFRNPANDTIWTVDNWPYTNIPEIDLGGTYAKTDDIWDISLSWAFSAQSIALTVSVDGEDTLAVSLVDGMGAPINPDEADNSHFVALAAALQTKIRALPSMTNDVTVTFDDLQSASRYRVFTVVFGGALSGVEYQLDARVANTADAAALVFHRQIGDTAGEPLVSTSKGWFSGMDLYQDRAVYFGPKARPAAINMSQTAEYFNLNIESQAETAARLEALRTQTSERILCVYELKYLLIFTDKAEWFITNRVIVRNEPVNIVRASKNGIRPHVPPVEMAGLVYYVSGGGGAETDDEEKGQMLYSSNYDDVTTTYNSKEESLLASHLVQDIDGAALQSKIRNNDAARWWMKDSAGRLICALVIRNQDILGLCEWIAAEGGQVKGLSVDGQNQVWVTVQRGATLTLEIFEEQERNLFQGAIRGGTDLAGVMSGLSLWNGRTVWARAGGFILGPYTVAGGQIDLGDYYAEVCVGLWQPPVYESMPFIKVLPDDSIIRRPGRIHSVTISVLETELIAVGANGGSAKNVPLLQPADPTDAPMPAKSQPVRVTGMPGQVMDPTLVITQTRPGRLRVRDYTPEAKL